MTLRPFAASNPTNAVPDGSVSPSELDRLKGLLEVTRSLTSELGLRDIIHGILAGAIKVIPAADAGVLFLYDRERGGLVANHAIGFGPSIYEIVVSPGEGLSGKAFISKQPQMYRDRLAVMRCMSDTKPTNLEYMRQATAGLTYAHSAITTPLVYKGEKLGALVVENLDSAEVFDDFDLELLDGLAQAAAVALVNARLYESERSARLSIEALHEDLRKRNEDLMRQVHIQEAFAAIASEGHPLQVVAARLAGICEASVIVIDRLCRVRAAAPKLTVSTAAEALGSVWPATESVLNEAEVKRSPAIVKMPQGELLVTPLRTGADVLGFILLTTMDRSVVDSDCTACGAAAVVAGADLLRERSVDEAQLRGGSFSVDDLLDGRPTSSSIKRTLTLPLVLALGCVVDTDPPNPLAHAKLLAVFGTAREVISREDPAAVCALRGPNLVVLASSRPEVIRVRLRSVSEYLARLPDHWNVVFAVSEPVASYTQVKDAYHELRSALAIHDQLNLTDHVFSVDSLGAYRLILRAATERDTLEICRPVLERVLPVDALSGGKILTTFRAYIANGYSISQTAKELRLHPHTIRYRLRRLEELAGLRLSTPADRLTLELGVRIIGAISGEH